jgi:hypothetical protein
MKSLGIDEENHKAYIQRMSKSVGYCTLIVTFAIVIVLSACAPNILSDNNTFLKSFSDEGLLNVLGVILAITVASAGQLHLTLNQAEERHGKIIFNRARSGVKAATYMLIALFLLAVLLVATKPMLSAAPWAQSLFNGTALFIVIWNVLLLLSLTQGIFGIKADLKTP